MAPPCLAEASSLGQNSAAAVLEAQHGPGTLKRKRSPSIASCSTAAQLYSHSNDFSMLCPLEMLAAACLLQESEDEQSGEVTGARGGLANGAYDYGADGTSAEAPSKTLRRTTRRTHQASLAVAPTATAASVRDTKPSERQVRSNVQQLPNTRARRCEAYELSSSEASVDGLAPAVSFESEQDVLYQLQHWWCSEQERQRAAAAAYRQSALQRYREKRERRNTTALPKVRYQSRKASADMRPRIKGRFAKAVPAEVAAVA